MNHLDYAIHFVGSIGFVVLVVWLTLKAYDALRAWKYNRKAARAREAAQAFADGCAFVMGEYARVKPQTYRVVRATPDRPKPDPWMKMVRDDIEEIFEELEGRI